MPITLLDFIKSGGDFALMGAKDIELADGSRLEGETLPPPDLLEGAVWKNGYVSWEITPSTQCSNGEVYTEVTNLMKVGTTYTFEHKVPLLHAWATWSNFVSFDANNNMLERLDFAPTEYVTDGEWGVVTREVTFTKPFASAYLSYRTQAFSGNSNPTAEQLALALEYAAQNTYLYDPAATMTTSKLLPRVTTDDNEKVAVVKNGVWTVGKPKYGLTAAVNPNINSINHRGYNSLAPENTLSAFRLSKEMGFDMVECDVSFTADGHAVLLHDLTVDRTSNGTGAIAELSFDYVRSLDFGSWKSANYAREQIPTFEEFIDLCRNLGLHPYIELKGSMTQERVNSLVQTVTEYGMLRKVTWISASGSLDGPMVMIADPKARFGCVVDALTEYIINIAKNMKTDENDVFINAHSSLTDELVAQCVEAGIPLEAWPNESVANILAAPKYVSGFTTDVLIAGAVLHDAEDVEPPEAPPLDATMQQAMVLVGTIEEATAALRQATSPAKSVDLSEFESAGKIVQTNKDNSTVTYLFGFDENGNLTQITDSEGNVMELIGFASLGGKTYEIAEGRSF